MTGKTGWQMLDKSRVTGKPSVVFYTPIVEDSEILGVMAGFYEQDRLDELFSFNFFNYTPSSYLLRGDGTVVASSDGDAVGENKLLELSSKRFRGDTKFADVQEAIDDAERTTITFSFENNNQTAIGVIVQFSNRDWMILSVLPESVTAEMFHQSARSNIQLILALAIVFIFALFIFMLLLHRQKKHLEEEMNLATENLRMSQKMDRRQLAIIQALSTVFASVYYVNLQRSDYTRITEQSGNVSDIPDGGDAKTGFSYYTETYVDPEYLPEMRRFLDVDTFAERVKGGSIQNIEYRRADGGWRRGSLIPAALDSDGSVISVVFAVQRIDLAKQKEQAAKDALEEAYRAAQLANQAKTTFLSNMSHDIRTPMNAIIGMTTIAAAHLNEPDKISECLKKITSSGKHLLGLINEVLDMSKIESGKVDLSEEEFSLSELLDNLISIHQPLIKEKEHTLTVKIHNLKHEKVIGDATRLQQVFTNLLSNAIKYTPAGGSLEISITEKDINKPTVGWFEVVFKDNGIGMSEEYQQTIFEPFTRAADKRISGIQGTGLGMPIAKNIIQMMGGNITVDSRLNEGSTFTVTFALKLQNEGKVDYSKFVDLPVLVADDDVSACESICTILNELTMNSEWVSSGREAVERSVARHEAGKDYYAVILDWKMPDMDGLAATRELRRRIGSDVPIIVISAYDWSDIETEAKAAGVNAFLSKPLFKSRLVGLFNELLGATDKEMTGPVGRLQSQDFSGKRLLLVEDNEINAEIAVELLEMASFKVETAENGKLGLEKFAAAKPGYYDLILMDVQMPVMNGYEATRAILDLDRPDAKRIPIVAMTANAFSSDVQDALDAGMNGHISKPIDIDRVIKVLTDFFSK